jgi:hypothetical protein
VISLLKIRSADGDGIAIHVQQGSNQGELEHGCAVRQKGAGMRNISIPSPALISAHFSYTEWISIGMLEAIAIR